MQRFARCGPAGLRITESLPPMVTGFLYADFIESDKEKGQCEFGLEEVFKSIFPIKDFSGSGELEFVKYELEEPKYDVDECIKRDMTYAAPVKATLRLVVWDIDEATGAKSIHDIKEQDVYMGDIPLMTDKGCLLYTSPSPRDA